MQFPQFVQFTQASGPKKEAHGNGTVGAETNALSVESETPEEAIDAAYRILRSALKNEILDRVKKMDPFRFEQLVLDLLVKMGYGGSREEAAYVTKASGDEGIDGVINQDQLGLDVIYLQAKRWQQNIGREEIQRFVGALAGKKAHKGVFITTSQFVNTAVLYAREVSHKIILIDGNRLAELMIDHDIGVAVHHAYKIKRVDSDYSWIAHFLSSFRHLNRLSDWGNLHA